MTIDSRIIGALEAIDELANAVLGVDPNIPAAGNPHFTVSQRLGEMLKFGTPEQKAYAEHCDAILTKISNDLGYPTQSHCLDSIKDFPVDLPKTG